MTDLHAMMENMQLSQCEAEIAQQLSSIASHPNAMKRAFLLSIMAEKTLAELDQVDAADYIKKLADRIEKLHQEYQARRDSMAEHNKENLLVCEKIDSLPESLRQMRMRADSALADFDEALAEAIRMRDNLPIDKTTSNGPA